MSGNPGKCVRLLSFDQCELCSRAENSEAGHGRGKVLKIAPGK